MSRKALSRALLWASAGLAVAAPGPVTASGASEPSVAWKISGAAEPTNLPLTKHNVGLGEPKDQYVLTLTNVGSVPSNGPIVLTESLPPGVTVGASLASPGWECPTGEAASVFTCTYNGTVSALGQSSTLVVPLSVAISGTVTSNVRVSGGGAPGTMMLDISTLAGPLPTSFAFTDFSSQAGDVSGAPDARAADHPYALTTAFDFPQRELESEPGRPEKPVRVPKAMEVELPEGLVGNPQAAPRCTIVELYAAHHCRLGSRVGTIFVNYSQGLFEGDSAFPVYNVVPEHGYPAEFGFYLEGLEKVAFMYGTVGQPPRYRLHLSIPNIPYTGKVANAVVSFFGDPTTMDGEGSSLPFFTNPSHCSGEPLVTNIDAESWEEPTHWVGAVAQAKPVSGCEALQFQPSVSLSPEISTADEPSGYTTDVRVPQAPGSGLEGLATPDVKDVTVTLPQGLSLSPAVADGLAACSAEGPEGINLSTPGRGHCPLASQVGTVEAVTPLLAAPLQGQLYVAQPGCGGTGQNPCTTADAVSGNLFGLYLQLEGSGVVIKVHGTASANPVTGQLTASFRETPQQPFSDLKLTLKGGPRAPLANPQTCSGALTTSDITPWSSPQTPDATPSWLFAVTGCEGSPFVPAFEAGTVNPAAGAYTNFTTTFSRSDRQQDLGAIQVQTPPGLLGMLSHVTLCGEAQAAAGTCSAASEIGTARASAGAGSHPFWASGPVYLTGPYNGAPFGLSVAIPAVAGPFNLGTVVVRAAINIDPSTSALTITSDPLPQIFRGVPLRIQTVNVTVNKPQFMFNPTNCEAQQITAQIASAQGSLAHVSTPFAAGGCKNLPFNPGFKVATRAPGSKKKGTSLDVKVSSAPGQANIHSISVSLPKQLPSRLTTIQQACPEATFAANPATCPAGSLIGVATGTTPVLSVPIVGPAYLVSHGGAAFPDLKFILQAEGVRVDLTGSINIKGQITSSTFASIPDVPISSFEVKLPEGPHSALTPNGNLCAKPLVMPTTIVGQNGRRLVRSTKITVAGCPKKKLAPKKKKLKRGK